MTIVALFSGYAFAGKTTCRNIFMGILFSQYKLPCFSESFAGKLKEIAKDAYGWDGNKDERGRKLLQNIGRTGREYDLDMWANIVADKFAPTWRGAVAIDDWRYPNEEQVFSSRGFDVIRIRVHRPSLDLSKEMYSDISETSLPEWDHTYYDFDIENVGTILDLQTKLWQIIYDYRRRNG